MKILLTGIDGYLGWPLALALSKKFKNSVIIGVDNLSRRKWVKNFKSDTAIPIQSISQRLKIAKKFGFKNIKFIKGDLVNSKFTENIFKKYNFDIVMHLAAQPSAPYANSSLSNAKFTLLNNNISTLNILWSIKKFGKKGIKFINTSTTGVYGQPNFKIPEGFIEAKYQKKKDIIPFTNLGGSWYHITKSNDLNNLHLANRIWGLNIIDIRTAIVYGTQTEETKLHPNLNTRFDFDYNFGVVLNRFCAMCLINHDITIYGKGILKRPFISLKDFVRSMVNLVKYKQKKSFEVFNQTTELLGIKYIGQTISNHAKKLGIKSKIKMIKNPRKEKEKHKMEMENKNFLKLLKSKPVVFSKESKIIIKDLLPFKKNIKKFKKSLI
tara:strand:- start:1137 stop:2279 length:1143 start_codon:yes stop_codon:yes gene_type:complete